MGAELEEVTLSSAHMRRKAGHQEILGETLAKFEFFQHGWHPYTRFLDIDKIDLILRRRRGNAVQYREIQVKFGKLYRCTIKWELPLFPHTSWRFFTEKSLDDLVERQGLYLAYVLAPDDGFKGDMFIFPIEEFVKCVRQADQVSSGNYRLYISKTHGDNPRWYIRKKRNFKELNDENVLDVTDYYRNFAILA